MQPIRWIYFTLTLHVRHTINNIIIATKENRQTSNEQTNIKLKSKELLKIGIDVCLYGRRCGSNMTTSRNPSVQCVVN